ncbi:MAG: TetR/AcrR family transcriptional regulator [Peptococcia bacterium]|jgi:AcrR family transcriptional regulator
MSGSCVTTKKEQIMEAALQIFSVKGFHLAKMEDIAHKAGVGKGTVYEYFSSKEELFKEILKEGVGTFDELLKEELSNAKTIKEKLQGLIRQSLIIWKRFHPLAKTTAMETAFLDSPFRSWLMEKHYERLLLIKDIIEEGIHQQEIRSINGLLFAHLFYGGLASMAGFYVEEDLESDKLELLIEETLDYYLKGIAKK